MAQARKMISDFTLYIIGTTATGKTKLSLALAQKFGGQIVSADSMQMYKHADILTAKVTKEEQSVVPHHMIDIFDLQVINFNRNDYFHLAKRSIDFVHSLHQFPIIIGGTNYYIETLLFQQKIAPNRIDLDHPNEFILDQQKKTIEQLDVNEENEQQDKKEQQEVVSKEVQETLDKMNLKEKYAKLQQIDSLLANKLHPNDERRITSYLTQALTSGTIPSEQMEDHENVPLRNKNCLIFWPRCSSKEKLENQIRKRIKEMVTPEGIWEAFFIFENILPEGVKSEDDPHFLKGVLQSIGYKEFFPFFLLFKNKMLPPTISREEKITQISQLMKEDEQGKKLIESCIDTLATHTVQYTKRQMKWIRHRILINSDSEEIKNRLFVYQFDEFTSEDFNKKVIEPATQVLQELFDKSKENTSSNTELIESLKKGVMGEYLIKETELSEVRKGHFKKGLKDWKNYFCEVCQKEIHGDQNMQIHNDSRNHKKALKAKEKREKRGKQTQQAIENELNKEEPKEDTLDNGEENCNVNENNVLNEH